MKNSTAIYLFLLAGCLIVSIVTLALYYSQDFKEEFAIKTSLKLSEIKFEAYDQGNYNNYNCAYDDNGVYKCDQAQGKTRLLRFASAEVGQVTLKNDGVFTQVYQTPRLLGCINFTKLIASNGQQFPKEFTIEYVPSDKVKGYNQYDYYGYYGSQNSQIEVQRGKTATYTLIARYQPNGIPLDDFNKDTIGQISIYKIPVKEDNPLGETYDYSSFAYNPSCENARQKGLDPIKVMRISWTLSTFEGIDF